MQYIFDYVEKTIHLLKVSQEVPNRDIWPNQMRSCFDFPWLEWGYCVSELPNKWPRDVHTYASILISSALCWLDRAWVARALRTAGTPGPGIFGHTQPYLLVPECVPYIYFMCHNVEKHEKQPKWLSYFATELLSINPLLPWHGWPK